MFSGLVFCNDCKQKLYYSTTNYFEKRQDFFICSTHRMNKGKCSGHYIRAVVLEQQVWKHIQEVISVVTRYEDYFRSEMGQKLRVQSEETMRIHMTRPWASWATRCPAVSGRDLASPRAFLHDVPFMLLDEPTSNLDSLNEAIILKSLREEKRDRTVVLVSHRESTMRIADRVHSVEHGRMS